MHDFTHLKYFKHLARPAEISTGEWERNEWNGMNDKMHHETRAVHDVIYYFERLNILTFLEWVFDFWIEFEFSGMNLSFLK